MEYRGGGRYYLLMTHYTNWFKSRLLPLGIKDVPHGNEKIVVMDDWNSDGSLWQFIEA